MQDSGRVAREPGDLDRGGILPNCELILREAMRAQDFALMPVHACILCARA